jgi:hypothetical protein
MLLTKKVRTDGVLEQTTGSPERWANFKTRGMVMEFGKQKNYHFAKQIDPIFDTDMEPWSFDEKYYLRKSGNDWYVVYEISGYVSLTTGYHPSKIKYLFSGNLKEAKNYLSDLVTKLEKSSGHPRRDYMEKTHGKKYK